MDLNAAIFFEILEQGLIYSLAVLGVYMSSRVIHFDDLTVEGSFGFGGALTAVAMMGGFPSGVALILAACGGCLLGLLTGILHTKFKMNSLISGICVTTAAFSLNLKWAGANISVGHKQTFLHGGDSFSWQTPATLLVIALSALYIVRWFLRTEIGFLIRASGNNPQLVLSLGKNPDTFKILSLALSNTLTALSGSLFVIWMGFFSYYRRSGHFNYCPHRTDLK